MADTVEQPTTYIVARARAMGYAPDPGDVTRISRRTVEILVERHGCPSPRASKRTWSARMAECTDAAIREVMTGT